MIGWQLASETRYRIPDTGCQQHFLIFELITQCFRVSVVIKEKSARNVSRKGPQSLPAAGMVPQSSAKF
jgi:hypothetical protein